jgi:hypothetical protein
MAQENSKIKKVIIPKSSLPEISGIGQDYVVRYRIVSEDKNRYSYWSQKYRVSIPNTTTVPFSVTKSNSTITAVWTPENNIKSEFDIYIKWDLEDWKYITTVYSTIYASVIKNGATKVKIAAQIPTFPKERFSSATLFESNEIDLVV